MANTQKEYIKKSKVLLKEVRKLEKKHRAKLHPGQLEKLDDVTQKLEAALQANADIDVAYEKLEQTAAMIYAPFRKSTFREYAESIVVAVAIALILRTFVVEPFKIPSGSMIPTLEIGDHIFVNKFSYGVWVPFKGEKVRIGSGPKRGDVIVFVYPLDPSKDFIKRVVGIPGDSIEVKNNVLYINGKQAKQIKGKMHTYKEREVDGGIWHKRAGRIFQEDLLGMKHRILLDPVTSPTLNSVDYKNWSSRIDAKATGRSWGPKVPANHVFVMGDNRDHSSDGREWGLVPMKNIKGKAVLIWLSFGGGKGFRWKRLFNLIQ